MDLIKLGADTIQIEFSVREFQSLSSIVYTADTDFDNLDATIYQLSEDKVADMASKIQDINRMISAALAKS